jgi:RNA ligase
MQIEKPEYHPSLEPYEDLVKRKYLTKSEKNGLVLYTYSDNTEFERYWNEYTRNARGIIFEKATGKIIAKPFPKFFNLGQSEETFVKNLPNEPYTVTEKMDGSLGIIFFYNGSWDVATKGSFYSVQAEKAREMLNKYNKNTLADLEGATLLAEIIYPENKIVVNYGNKEKLVLLAIYEADGDEHSYNACKYYAKELGMEIAKEYQYTIEQMIELQKTIPKDQEGFVVRYQNGLRLKIKGEEYLRIHRAIADCTPLNVWRNMKNGRLDPEFKKHLPDEIMPDIVKYQVSLEHKYDDLKTEIYANLLPILEKVGNDKRNLGMYLKANDILHSSCAFPILLDRYEAVDKYIMEKIRPTGNML